MKIHPLECRTCLNRKNSLFTYCIPEELESLDLRKKSNIYKKGDILFSEGSFPLGVYCINSGSVKIVKKNNDGKEQIIRLAKPGDLIGYRSLLAGTKYSASAVLFEDSVACFIPGDLFEKLLRGNEFLEFQLIKKLSAALGEAEGRIAMMTLKPVKERLAEILLLLDKLYSQGNNGVWFTVSRDDLGSLVGTAKETGIRLLTELKEENIIETRGSKIRILDKEKLLHISHLHD
jgi:CRP-like cAMP-binding protein